jgi:hypothetical protein
MVDLFRLPMLPIMGSIMTILFFFFDVGMGSYSSILEGAVNRLLYYSFYF